jgi:hypothetical protein
VHFSFSPEKLANEIHGTVVGPVVKRKLRVFRNASENNAERTIVCRATMAWFNRYGDVNGRP